MSVQTHAYLCVYEHAPTNTNKTKCARVHTNMCAQNIHINTFPHILSLTQASAAELAAEQQVVANAVAAKTAADEIAKALEVAAAAAIIAAHQQSIVDNATALAFDIAAETQVITSSTCTQPHAHTQEHTHTHKSTRTHKRAHATILQTDSTTPDRSCCKTSQVQSLWQQRRQLWQPKTWLLQQSQRKLMTLQQQH